MIGSKQNGSLGSNVDAASIARVTMLQLQPSRKATRERRGTVGSDEFTN